jgi:hypothetical protein
MQARHTDGRRGCPVELDVAQGGASVRLQQCRAGIACIRGRRLMLPSDQPRVGFRMRHTATAASAAASTASVSAAGRKPAGAGGGGGDDTAAAAVAGTAGSGCAAMLRAACEGPPTARTRLPRTSQTPPRPAARPLPARRAAAPAPRPAAACPACPAGLGGGQRVRCGQRTGA